MLSEIYKGLPNRHRATEPEGMTDKIGVYFARAREIDSRKSQM